MRIVKPSKEERVQFGCRLPVTLVRRLDSVRHASGTTMTATVEQLLEWALAKYEREEERRNDAFRGIP